MVIQKQLTRRLPAWYILALLHYMGDEQWAVGLLRRSVTTDGLKDRWEWVEGLSHDEAIELLDKNQKRLVRCTPGDLSKVIAHA